MSTQGFADSLIEIGVLYAMTATGIRLYFATDWLLALLLGPVVMLAMFVAVLILVQLLWVAICGLERCGELLGLRKSPLS
jgi:hypothetical protein